MKNFGLISRLRSAAATFSDGNTSVMRSNQLSEQIVAPHSSQQFAVEGSYWVSQTPTPGTGTAITTGTQSAFAATAPSFLIRNTAAIGGKDLILKRLRLIVVSAGTGLASWESLCVVDSTNRYASGGVAIVPSNAKADESAASVSQIFIASNPIAASAAGITARLIARHKIKAAIPVVGDTYVIAFGAEPGAANVPLAGTAAALSTQDASPFIVPPQGTALIYFWGPTMLLAPTFEIQIEHVER